MDVNRRGFLRKVAQAGVAAGVLAPWHAAGRESSSGTAERPSFPIIDTHQHLWDLTRFKLIWLRPPLDRSFTPEDYRQASAGLGIVRAVYMEVAVPPGQRVEEAEYAIGLCREPEGLTCAAVIAGQPGEEGFESYVTRFRDNACIKGVRGSLGSAERMNDPQVVKHLCLLGDLGMRFDLNVSPPLLAEAARLVERCPGTRFILDHCGNADPVAFFPAGRAAPRRSGHTPQQWREGIDRLAARANVVCKISGLVDNVPGYPLTAADLAPIIDHCLGAFGPQRVLFAGDWPVCLLGTSLRGWVALLREVISSRPQRQQRQLFHDNAVRCYDLPAEAAREDDRGSR